MPSPKTDQRVPIGEARESFGSIVSMAQFASKRTVLTKHGVDVAAIIPIEEFDLLSRLIELWGYAAIETVLKAAAELDPKNGNGSGDIAK